MNLDALLQRADIWRGGGASPYETGRSLPSGNPELDESIGGGWPLGGLTELLIAQPGTGELRLLLPALARLSAPIFSRGENVANTLLQTPSPLQGEGWDGGSGCEIHEITSSYPHPDPPPARADYYPHWTQQLKVPPPWRRT